MRLRILPELGGKKLSEVTRVNVQDLADRLVADGKDASTVRNTLMPLRAIFRRAVSRSELAVNPTAGLELPAVTGRRDRIASVAEGVALVQAVPEEDRVIWATAMFAGLRLGELQALRDEDVDLHAGVMKIINDPVQRWFHADVFASTRTVLEHIRWSDPPKSPAERRRDNARLQREIEHDIEVFGYHRTA
jgi:site-specific recombinase XerC